MKFCKDCTHFKHHEFPAPESSPTYDGDCVHPIVNPVTGAVIPTFVNGCQWARTAGPCGWDAKWFEPQTQG